MTAPNTSLPPPRRARLPLLVGLLITTAFVAAPQDKTAPLPRHGVFIGPAACQECHEDEASKLREGGHAPVLGDAHLQACETCHGPGKRHADNEENDPRLITHPPKLVRASQEQLCRRCHAERVANHGGDLDGFYAAGKRCTDCHQVHTKKAPPAHPNTNFLTRAAANQKATPVGAEKCLTCHPLRNDKLADTGHAGLMAKTDPKGCETCHGNGSLHVATGGLARLITRADRATDGVATCRSCHEAVDAAEFHWKDRHKPLLTPGMTCTTCHTVHAPPQPKAAPRAAPTSRPSRTARSQPAPEPRMRGPLAQVDNGSCARCHAPAYGVLRGTVHESLARRDLPIAEGCGGCHAGAAEHARGPGRKDLVDSLHGTDAAHQLATCAQCHERDAALHETRAGSHHRHQVTCLTCHSPATPRGKTRETASQRCAECHQKAAAEFRMPNHHPVKINALDRGTMACVDCHDPHSARPRIRDRQLRQERCVTCHKQYRGPFVFAHQASRTEGCVACHSPHGSTNRRMLKQTTTQQNCIACHADFPSFHDQTTGAVFTNCLNCHTQVHGSNHSRYLFR